MNKLQVYLKDYSMMIIDCDRGVAAELSEFFSFFVPGYKWMPAYKNKVWDGKIRLFNGMTNELNAGLFVYLYNFCKERNYKLDVVENGKSSRWLYSSYGWTSVLTKKITKQYQLNATEFNRILGID